MGLGLGATLGATRWACALPRPGGEPGVVWAVDHWRGCAMLVGPSLAIQRVLPLGAARRLAIGAERMWAVAGPGRQQRVLTRPRGSGRSWEPGWPLPLGAVSQLKAVGERAAYLLLEEKRGAGLWRLEVGREPLCLEAPRSAVRRTLVAGQMLTQDPATGQWVLHALGIDGLRVRRSVWAAETLQRALPGHTGGWWCITGEEGDRLELRDGRLQLIWSRPLEFRATALVPCEAGVLVLGGKRLAGRCFDPDGLSGRLLEWNLRGPLRGALALGEGWLLALPGALLKLAPDGVIECTQGGFGELLGLASADPRASQAGSFLGGG